MQVTEYDPETGWLLGMWTMDESMIDAWGRPHVEGAHDPMTHFVDIHAAQPHVKPRPRLEMRRNKAVIKANGEDIVKFSDLPIPCLITIRDAEYRVEDGVFEWGTRLAGDYVIKISAFPYLDWEGTVRAE